MVKSTHMANWHVAIKGIPWCCHGDLEREVSPAVRDALFRVCCGQGSMSDALSLKAALAEMGYADWDEIDIVRNACEIRIPPNDSEMLSAAQPPLEPKQR